MLIQLPFSASFVLSIQYVVIVEGTKQPEMQSQTLTFIHYSGSAGAQSPEKMEVVGSSETGTLLHN